MRFKFRSVIGTSWTIPCLPVKRIISLLPVRFTCRDLIVVAPKLLLSRTYCSLPIRRYSVSSRRTTAARTASRLTAGFLRSAATLRRIFGSAAPNSSVPLYFFLSRLERKAAW